MAGEARPSIEGLGEEVLPVTYSFEGSAAIGTPGSADQVWDGILGDYLNNHMYIYPGWFEMTVGEDFRWWAYPASSYPRYINPCNLFRYNEDTSSWDLLGQTYNNDSTVQWVLLWPETLPAGRYKIDNTGLTPQYFLVTEFFLESMKTSLYSPGQSTLISTLGKAPVDLEGTTKIVSFTVDADVPAGTQVLGAVSFDSGATWSVPAQGQLREVTGPEVGLPIEELEHGLAGLKPPEGASELHLGFLLRTYTESDTPVVRGVTVNKEVVKV